MSVGGTLRMLRAAMFAAVSVVFAAVGHVVMSGAGLPWWVLLSGVTAVGVVGWAVGGCERGWPAVAGLTVAVQTGLHVGFTLAQSTARLSTAASHDTRTVQQWARYVLCGADPTPEAAARAFDIAQQAGLTQHLGQVSGHDAGAVASAGHDMASMVGTASWGMLAAHVLSAILCGLWLAQGERAAFALARACADRAFVPLRLTLIVLAPLSRPPAIRPARRTRSRLRLHLLVHSLITRGPPAEIAVV